MVYRKFQSADVEKKFGSYPQEVRKKLLFLRDLVFSVASSFEEVGEIEETLKWDEPSYLTSQTNSGSTIRIDWKKARPDQYEMNLNCRTSLISDIKEIYGDLLDYRGNRSIIFKVKEPIPKDIISFCIAMALKYKLSKKKS